MKIALSHVSVLVPSVQKAAERLKPFGFRIHPMDEFDGEGTREIYVEADKANSLLLMEAFKPGAYQRAMDKRGPGLHHLAIDVLDIDEFVDSLSGSGWLLHPKSLKYYNAIKNVYLSRPGFPALIEVQQKKELREGPLFVEGIELQMDSKFAKLLKSIGMTNVVNPTTNESVLILSGQKLKLKELF